MPRGARKQSKANVYHARSQNRTQVYDSEQKRGGRSRGKSAYRCRRGGKTTKIHAIVDSLGNPIHFHLTSGNFHDSKEAETSLSDVLLEGTVVLADKAYGSKAIRSFITASAAGFCIPPKANETSWPCDWSQYMERHLVIRCQINRLDSHNKMRVFCAFQSNS